MAGLARALAVPAAGPRWGELRELFLHARGPEERDGLAAALAGAATPDNVDALIELVRDPSLGQLRAYFVDPIARLGGAAGRRVVAELRRDLGLSTEASAVLARRERL